MSQTWTEYEKGLHKKYNIPETEQIVAILGNGTVVTLPKVSLPSQAILPRQTSPDLVLPPPDDYVTEERK